jgi:hypothetical protein
MIDREVPTPEADEQSSKGGEQSSGEDRSARKVEKDRERRQPQAVVEVPSCPICGRRWDEHNLVRVRECMPKLEEALHLAERARIRASLS